MKCSICKGEIEVQFGPDGEAFWDKGHNPAPLIIEEDDRCCGVCNDTVVTPLRIAMVMSKDGEKVAREALLIARAMSVMTQEETQ